MRPRILVTESLDPVCAQWLIDRAEVVHCSHRQSIEQFNSHLGTADGLLIRSYTTVNAALLDKGSRLKVVGRAGVGLDNIDLQACQQRGIAVVYTPDANTHAVVEYVVGLILDALRPRATMPPSLPEESFHHMRREHVGQQLDQLTLGILGFGRIGKRLGKVAHALGMRLLVNDLVPDGQIRGGVDYPVEVVNKETLYCRSDVFTIHVDGRPSNRHLIDASSLSQLKPSCLLINTSRGMVVEPTALVRWANTVVDRGGSAVLDVHDPEPPPQNYVLYHHPNIRLLPHLASRTDTALRNMSWVVRDVMAVLTGQTPRYPAS